jgi:flagellar basal-body rod protein FlgB
MITDLGGVTAQMARLALDASVMRHQAIAQNIANGNTPGYRPMRVNFEQQLSTMRTELLERSNDTAMSAQLKTVQPQFEREHATVQADPRAMLDVEMVKLAQNVVHYQAILKGMSKYMAPISLAINDGRR